VGCGEGAETSCFDSLLICGTTVAVVIKYAWSAEVSSNVLIDELQLRNIGRKGPGLLVAGGQPPPRKDRRRILITPATPMTTRSLAPTHSKRHR